MTSDQLKRFALMFYDVAIVTLLIQLINYSSTPAPIWPDMTLRTLASVGLVLWAACYTTHNFQKITPTP